MTSVPTTPAPAVAAPTAPAAPACPADRADEAAALVTARICGGKVQISSATSETSRAWALPTGSVEREVNAAPVRVKQGANWVPVNLDLAAQPDGSVAPKAHPRSLVVSGRTSGTGVHALAELGAGANVAALGWSGPLPQPTLAANKATYAEVRPGVDLVVEATVTGVESFYVVKTRDAAKEVAELTLSVTGTLVASHRRTADGAVALLDAKGKTVATSPAPLMWDARLDASSQAPAQVRAVGSAATARKARVEGPKAKAVDGAGVDLTLTPDAKFLADPATVYPVIIDPQLTLDDPTWDTWVKDGTTTDQSTLHYLQIGLVGGKVARSFVNFDVSSLKGKYINSATTGFYNYASNSCTNVDWEIWSVNASDINTRWTNQPTWKTKEGQSSATKGGPNACVADGMVYVDSKQYFQRQADEQRNIGYMGVRATDETVAAGGKNFYSQNYTDVTKSPLAIINYSSFPTTSALATSPSTPCVTGTTRPYVNTATPLLQARVTDTDGASVRPEFAWSTTAGTAIGSAQPTPGRVSGALFGTTVPSGAFANNGSYSWKVRGYDGTTWGPWSAVCEFTVDTTAPSVAPSVSSTTYPANTWSAAAGTAGTFTFGASSVVDVAAYVYGLDTDTPTNTVNPATLGGGASVSITPAADGPHTLNVQARDRAGNLSPVTAYTFNVGAGAVISPEDGDMSAGKVALQGQGRPTTTGVTFEWRRGDADAWVTIPAADVTVAAGGTAVTWPVATTGSGAYPKLTWNLEQTVNNAEAGPDALDGPVQVRASFSGTTGISSAVHASLDRNQASATSETVGSGSVNLLTGNYTVSDTDVSVDSFGSDLTVNRSYNTRRATEVDSANMFGPGWAASVVDHGAEAPYTRLNRTGSLVQVGVSDGDTVAFTARTTTAFVPEPGKEDLDLTYNSTADSYTLDDDDSGTSVVFARVTGSPAGTYHPTTIKEQGSGEITTLTWAKVTVAGVDVYRPTQMLAPVPSGVTSCTPLVQGCRALTITYATATTATGTTTATWGDYLGRVKEISFTAFDPDLATPAMRTVALARYSYDNTGKLRFVWDPRLDYTNGNGAQRVGKTYDYNTDGILATITPAGQEPWQLTYTTVPGDTGKGRLAAVTRSALSAGTATISVVYKIPTGSTGPNNLSATQTVRWGQSEQPVDATAIYPATQIPDGNQATGVLPSSMQRATITYLDANGRAVNTADPGGNITTTWYDEYGNDTRSLDGGNRRRALDVSSTDTPAQEAGVAARLSTVNTYSADGQQLLDTLGPEHDVVLPDSSSVRGRTHTHNVYDENATGGPYNLLTTTTTTARYTVNGVDTDTDARTITTGYDWTTLLPTSTTIDPGGLNQVTRIAYDATTSLITSITSPAGGGSTTTPSTRATVYYRAGTGSGYTECDTKPHWANLPCRVQPGGQPTTGAEIPVRVATYDMFNQPRVITEKTSTATLRTTTVTYDTAARIYQTTTTGTGAGTSTPAVRNVYDPATQQHTKTQSVVSGSVTAEVIRAYDTLGRPTSYTDADGATSTVTYDISSRIATSNDGKATRTYTYDSGTELRGLLTQVVDSQAGTFTASYNSSGQMDHHTWPTGVTTNQYYNETGEPTGIEYLTSSSCTTAACTLFTDYVGQNAHGSDQWDANSLDNFGYTYDRAGRLTDVAHTTTTGCSLRKYTYDTASNRTGLSDYGPEAGSCSTANPAQSRTWTYDTADRLTSTGYTYDALGRTLTVPSADTANNAGTLTVTYHNTDLVDTIAQNGRTTNYALDVIDQRIRSWTDTTPAGSTTHTHHYNTDSDSPSWTQETTSSYTRPVLGVSGLTGIYDSATSTVDYQITNLHGDVAATIHGTATGLTTTSLNDEYGNPANLSDIGTKRYGWLGKNQRAADTPAGITIMGIRLYNPATGRFLSVDPVEGGSANDYDYSNQDPVNNVDLDGRCVCDFIKLAVKAVGRVITVTMNATTGFVLTKAAQVAMIGRFPARCAPSPRRGNCGYRGKSWGYQINYDGNKVYKYGITSVDPPSYRAGRSLVQCIAESFTNGCYIVRYKTFTTRYQARVWEWSQCAGYVLVYKHRPLGMKRACV